MPLDNPASIVFPVSTRGNHTRVTLTANSARQVLDNNPNRKSALIQNLSTNQITLQLSDVVGAAIGKGIILFPGGSYEINLLNLHTGRVSAISGAESEIGVTDCI